MSLLDDLAADRARDAVPAVPPVPAAAAPAAAGDGTPSFASSMRVTPLRWQLPTLDRRDGAVELALGPVTLTLEARPRG